MLDMDDKFAAGSCALISSSLSVSLACNATEVPTGARFFLVILARALRVLSFPLGGAVLVDSISASYSSNEQMECLQMF